MSHNKMPIRKKMCQSLVWLWLGKGSKMGSLRWCFSGGSTVMQRSMWCDKSFHKLCKAARQQQCLFLFLSTYRRSDVSNSPTNTSLKV